LLSGVDTSISSVSSSAMGMQVLLLLLLSCKLNIFCLF
jgi:hypothetical protein